MEAEILAPLTANELCLNVTSRLRTAHRDLSARKLFSARQGSSTSAGPLAGEPDSALACNTETSQRFEIAR